jgi:inosine-uridine nucleoside N-ribohydrolase
MASEAAVRRTFLKSMLATSVAGWLRPGRVWAAEGPTPCAGNATTGATRERLVPRVPPVGERIRLVIDSDAAAEIDDLYAISLAIAAPERFRIEGFVATHFAAAAGPESIALSYQAIKKILEITGTVDKYPLKRGGHPMNYLGVPSASEGADWIIRRAHQGSAENPLWVVGIGAATNLASAVLKDPSITAKVRYVFHARSPQTWPQRSVQFNVMGDINAARSLLSSRVPLVWFDAGTNLTATMAETEKNLATTKIGQYLHNFRYRNPGFARSDKGFFDLGDIAWLISPSVAKSEVVPAPSMNGFMYFVPTTKNGNMRRVFEIDKTATWNLFYDKISKSASPS